MSYSKLGLIDMAAGLGLLVSAGFVLSSATGTPRSHAALAVAPTAIRLGEVDQGAAVPFAFTLVNNDSRALTIKETVVPCSCTEVDLPAGTAIEAQGRREVTGRLQTAGKRGPYNATFAISYGVEPGEGEAPEPGNTLLVPLSVVVRPAVKCSPARVTINPRSWTDVVLTSDTARSFRVQSVETSDPFILYESVDSRLDEDSRRFQIWLRSDPSRYPDPSLRAAGGRSVKFITNDPANSPIVVDVVIEGFK